MTSSAMSGISGWRAAHEALTRLARARAGLDFEEGEKLLAAQRARVQERLGFGSFLEYIERLFGYSPRLTLEKLRVAEAMEGLPQLAEALRAGDASWSSLRELTRVAVPETEREWLDAARGQTVREVEKLVSGHRPGELPDAVKDWRAERHVLRFEVSGEVLATFREAMASLRRDAGGRLDDDAALLLMARHVLAGPADDGRASYQVAIGICEACAMATQAGDGESAPILPEIAEMARCDGQELRLANANGSHAANPAEQSAAVSMVNQLRQRDVVDGAHAGTIVPRASQTIPPAVRRIVLRRDCHRCQVPGCRHATFVDVHHLRAREQGGGHEVENLLTLCSAHHRACHRGHLIIERNASGTLSFRHADGTAYGEPPSVDEADARACAFRALRKLGFGEREVRRALDETSTHVGNHGEVESLIRCALDRLTQDSFAKAS